MRKIKLLIGLLAVTIVAVLTLSGPNNDSKVTAATNEQKSLIVYFSLSGTTKNAAEKIKAATGADMIRLQPKKAYPAGYDNYVKVAQRQLKRKIHPAIKTKIPQLDQYQTIYIGFPTWWHQPPMIVYSLFDKFNFSGKTIVPFTTSMSDPISKSMPYLRRLFSQKGARNNHFWLPLC
ncbi:flavodoxin [Lactiplantibacillus pentosus]|uniref:flavodoxin n=1 Tax=Lactiplantibacillus pentosus TaxID=1589 RepID=UPI000D020446|nr:flavodoxin [Lactiplantibacillus pentosus]PRO77957.1 flavodoxin [Lactiplantibacillus pentosus]